MNNSCDAFSNQNTDLHFPSWIDYLKKERWDSCIVLIRHEEKEFNRPEGGFRQLTENGRRRAFQIGSILKDVRRNETFFFSSPIQRCFDTASLIAEGMGENVNVIKSDDLLTAVYNSGMDWSDTEGYNRYVNGHVIEGHDHPRIGARKMLDVALPNLEKDGNLTICVSHDLAIAILNAMVTKRFRSGNWMDYADGVLIMRCGNDVKLMRNGVPYDLFDSFERDSVVDTSP